MDIKQNALDLFKDESLVNVMNKAYAHEVESILSVLFKSDKGNNGDITTKMLIDKDLMATASVISKDNGIFAGAQELKIFIAQFQKGKKLKASFLKNDGDKINSGDVLLTIKGNAWQILSIERTLLNLLQRLSGIASLTNKYVKKVPKNVLICATRKTVWGVLDKRACFIGGGGTHRMNLGDALLVKNNHIDLLNGNYDEVLKSIKKSNKGRFIDFEIRTKREAEKVFQWIKHNGRIISKIPVIVMFDNFNSEELRRLIKILNKKFGLKDIILEASGGINENNIKEYAKTGVDILSIGELTHSVKALDISMKIMPN